MSENKLKGKVILTGKIVVKTGLAIGGNKTALDIGGVDSPVIKDARGIPYIPGSSIKGKLRSLLEQSTYPLRRKKDAEEKRDGLGYFDENITIHRFLNPEDGQTDEVIQIFGSPDVDEPVRGIFRDAYLDMAHFITHREDLFDNLELDYTEDKIENSIDRISARANPRHLERVPNGAQFGFEIILDLYSAKDQELINVLLQAMKLLEDDYLGGSGSRGSGKIYFDIDSMLYRSIPYYKGTETEKILAKDEKLDDLKNQDWTKNAII